MRRAPVVLPMLTLVLARVAAGQRVTEALIGSRVRLDTASGALLTGTLVSLDADTVRLASSRAGAVMAVPRARIVSFEISEGRERGRGAQRGALVGGALALAVLIASLRTDTTAVHQQSRELQLAVPVSLGLVALGAGIGAALAPERWGSLARVSARAGVRVVACPGACVAVGYRRAWN